MQTSQEQPVKGLSESLGTYAGELSSFITSESQKLTL